MSSPNVINSTSSVSRPLPESFSACQHPEHHNVLTLEPTGKLRMQNLPPHSPQKPSAPVRTTTVNGLCTGEENRADEGIGVRGERAMWRAVIVQALMDASCGSKKPEALQNKQEALIWLRGTSRDFATVAYHAGFTPEYLRRMVQEALENNCSWRALPGKGSRQHPHRKKKTENLPGQRR